MARSEGSLAAALSIYWPKIGLLALEPSHEVAL